MHLKACRYMYTHVQVYIFLQSYLFVCLYIYVPPGDHVKQKTQPT